MVPSPRMFARKKDPWDGRRIRGCDNVLAHNEKRDKLYKHALVGGCQLKGEFGELVGGKQE